MNQDKDNLDMPYQIDYEDFEVQSRLKSIEKFYGNYDINTYDNLALKSKAYPNFESHYPIDSPRDTNKWLNAIQTIYYKEKNGLERSEALSHVINSWEDMEKLDFLSWLKFYEEGTHLKYKTAQDQNWYTGTAPGYFLPVTKKPTSFSNDFQEAKDSEETSTFEKKQIIEKQRQKIIGRLDSTEKLLRSEDGQLFAGKEFEMLLEIIYQLKKKIQMVNKKSASTKLYEDLIVREANVLNHNGFYKAAEVLYKLSAFPASSPPAPPTNVSGSPTTVPSAAAGNSPPGNDPPNLLKSPSKENVADEGMKDFLNGLKGGNLSDEVLKIDDCLEVNDLDSDLIVEAQVTPAVDNDVKPTPSPSPAQPSQDVKVPIKSDDDLEVTEDQSDAPAQDFDNLIDVAFANLKVDDIVAKLEDLAKIFKNREVPRQLSIVDMMLDKLGISSFFPSLAEATNKALESNQYVLTRVEDILAKLRGTMHATKEVDLTSSNETPPAPEVAELQKRLKEDSDKEKEKKQLRKKLEDKSLQEKSVEKETPEIEIEEGLSEPVNISETPTSPQPPAPVPAPAQPKTK